MIDRIDQLKNNGVVVTDADFKKWNANCGKTVSLEEQLEKLRKDVAAMDGVQIKAEINRISVLVLNMTPKADFEKLAM